LVKKRVLHVIKGLGRGGAERLLVSTIPHHHSDYEFEVVYFLPCKNQLVKDLEARGCRVTLIPSRNVLMMVLNLPVLVRMIRTGRYDLLHAHLPWAGIIVRVVGKLLNIPVVYTEHNLFNRYRGITRLCSRLTFSWQKRVIAVSDRVAEVLNESLQSSVPIKVIANGVDVEEFRKSDQSTASWSVEEPGRAGQPASGPWLGFPQDSLIVGTIAGLSDQKRIDRWIQIATAVVQRNPRVGFVVVGDGVLRQRLEEQAGHLKKENKIRFVGMTSQPAAWLDCFDIFLMSSDFEGLPVALLEAMSMECVAVSTAVGGIPTVIDHGRTGYLYEPEQWQQAVDVILDLANKPAVRQQMGMAARQTVIRKFSVVRMVKELEYLYATVWKTEPRPTPPLSSHPIPARN